MVSFLAGLFVVEGLFEGIKDNRDLERWFRLPKSYEQQIQAIATRGSHRSGGSRCRVGKTLRRRRG
jgi:hypothetical protein